MSDHRQSEDPFAHLRVLTIKEVSRLTSYTPQHIYRLCREGKFPARIRLGENRVGWLAKDIEAWLKSRPIVLPPPTKNDNEPLTGRRDNEMPQFYEAAAHLLIFLINAGLVVKQGIDHREVVSRIADRISVIDREKRSLSDYSKATWLLSDLEEQGLVTRKRQGRPKLLAILGTALANNLSTSVHNKNAA